MQKSAEIVLKKYGIGLTGGIATGKSTIAKILTELGYVVIDADKLAKEIIGPNSSGAKKVIRVFGSKIVDADGNIDRKKLATIIFSSKTEQKKLETITHPLIEKKLKSELKRLNLLAQPKPWFYEASLIIENGKAKRFKEIWVTLCSPQNQLERLMRRSKLDESAAKKMIAAQLDPKKKAKMADLVINTNVTLAALRNQILDQVREHLAFRG